MAKTTKKVAKKAAKKIESLYSVQIKIMGKLFKSEGSTLDEAIDNLKVGNAKGVSLMTVSKGEVIRNRVLTPPQTFRLFSPSKLMRAASYKQMSQIFNF